MNREDSKIWNLYTEANTPVVKPKFTSEEKAKLEKMISEGEVLREQTTKLEKLK